MKSLNEEFTEQKANRMLHEAKIGNKICSNFKKIKANLKEFIAQVRGTHVRAKWKVKQH